jgi:hypothetical protein
MILLAILLALCIGIFAVKRASAHHRAAHWRPSALWMTQALCVHRHEAAWTNPGLTWDGRRSIYYGGMQFALSTWKRAGGSGYPHRASPREQLYRAWRIWRMNGGRWNEWPTFARYCA